MARRHNSRALLVAAALSMSLILVGCGTDGEGDGGTSGESTEALTVGLVMLQSDEYFNGIKAGAEEAAGADGDEIVSAVSNNDAGTEASTVQSMVQRQIDALLIQPVSGDGSLATLKTAKSADIPVICYGNCTGATVDPANVDGVVQSDNTALGTATGEAAAAFIMENLDGKATIGILNCDAAAETCKLRKAGFKAALEDAGVEAVYAADQEGYLADKATPVAVNMLSANPDINLLWSANEGGTVGLVTASKQSGKAVPVFGTDISEQLAGFLLDEDNILQATTGQDPKSTIATALAQAKTVLAGDTNDPLEVLVPGVTYDRRDPDAINSYLGN